MVYGPNFMVHSALKDSTLQCSGAPAVRNETTYRAKGLTNFVMSDVQWLGPYDSCNRKDSSA